MSETGAPRATVGLVLAGGKSARMGRDKTALLLPGSGQTSLLVHMRQRLLAAGCVDVLISGAAVGGLPDRYENAGPLAGIDSAMAALAERRMPAQLLIVPVDMPALSAALLQQLSNAGLDLGADDAVHFAEHPLPLCLACNERVRQTVAVALAGAGSHSLRVLADRLQATPLPVAPEQEREFVNINTPTDWAAWQSASAAETPS